MPSTSKCSQCVYESDDENHIKIRRKLKLALTCELCTFETEDSDEIDTHELFEHDLARWWQSYCKICTSSKKPCGWVPYTLKVINKLSDQFRSSKLYILMLNEIQGHLVAKTFFMN